MENPSSSAGVASPVDDSNPRAAAPADEHQRALAETVGALLAAPPGPGRHLAALETARAQIARVQATLSLRYAAHPLPPDGIENDTLARVVGLWRTLARSYAHLAEAAAADEAAPAHAALVAQRRVVAAGNALLEYFRAHRSAPPGAWAELHAAYVAAEAQDVARVRVADPLNETWKAQSPAEAYVAVLLVDLANPFGRSPREFDWVGRWARRFAPYCAVEHADPGDGEKPGAYGLELSADHGLRPLGMLPASATRRRFDGSRLAGQIRGVIGQFKQGATPVSLGLGADCPPDASMRLLLSLYRPWGLASSGRRFPRRGCAGDAELCGDWLAIGFNVAGRPFEQPLLFSAANTQRELARLTFGERAAGPRREVDRHREAERLGFAAERWSLADQSVGGFRLRQRPQGERLEHRQLVGIRPPDGERFLLGQVSWLMYRDDGIMEAGINVLAGVPKVVAARQTGLLRGQHIAYQQAFLLPGIAALKSGPSLVVPAGWYRLHAVIDVYDERPLQLRLTGVVLQGTNFEQVSFEAVGAPLRDAPPGNAR